MITKDDGTVVTDLVKDDYCHGCKYAALKPERHISSPWERRYYCKNKHRLAATVADISQMWRKFCKVVEQDNEKFPLDELTVIRQRIEELWLNMRESNWSVLEPVENAVGCPYREE